MAIKKRTHFQIGCDNFLCWFKKIGRTAYISAIIDKLCLLAETMCLKLFGLPAEPYFHVSLLGWWCKYGYGMFPFLWTVPVTNSFGYCRIHVYVHTLFLDQIYLLFENTWFNSFIWSEHATEKVATLSCHYVNKY